ncbi:MAG: methylated-DNA--[protein]-cysteine S-methyltransferase [Clostridiales bacterium]|nr:methylated-DNA--[protein]-cysteine S-methyltransferase [Clostridiales bacterium]
MKKRCFKSPLGYLLAVEEDGALTALDFVQAEDQDARDLSPVLLLTEKQLGEYFAGLREKFEVPLQLKGSDFQKKVWASLLDIPYGQTRTYGQIAAQIGQPKASRAVGQANNRNPIAIIVPCHRVVGADGALTGYGGGLARKEALLMIERNLEK